ncbi:FecR domain-containing protein [Candidatus Peregrinibacteria bacterium]|nr:FecR domain-containing protein [Candidatus Peregrinibacteria bacterium]
MNNISDEQITEAKRRIWAKMSDKLPDRGIGGALMRASAIDISRLHKFQIKERLFDSLPDLPRVPSFSEKFRTMFMQKRVMSLAVLSFFFALIFAPIFRFVPVVLADSTNILEVSQGTAFINRGGEKIKIVDQTAVLQGDKIEIADDSIAHLYFSDDSQMTLGPGTVLVVTEVYVEPGNKARTEVVVDQFSGRSWIQVLNLVGKDSFFSFRFPDGEISVKQRSSFDVNVEQSGTQIQVAKNLVEVMVSQGSKIHSGTLGQGVQMNIRGAEILTSELSDEDKNDVWWKFNLAFEKSYARTVDEKYKKEAIARVLILPGNPLYKLKTFQESVQSFVSFSKSAKQELAVQRAQNRLREAQSLLAQGKDDQIESVLSDYQDAVDEAVKLSGGDKILAKTEEVQKEVLSFQDSNADTLLLSASQRLHSVPDLIENGNFDLAYQYLTYYRDESRAVLTDLESVPLESREDLIIEFLDRKLKDLQMLRIIAAMPEFSGSVNVDAQTFQEMSMMVLSLRERELNHLSEFFTSAAENRDVQILVYSKLRNSVDLDENVSDMLNKVEDQLSGSGLVVDLEVSAAPSDHRLDAHADKAQD